MIGNAPFFVVGVLFLMGLVSIFLSKNLIKIAIAISIIGSAVNIFLVSLGYKAGGTSQCIFSQVREPPWCFPHPRP